MHNKTQKIVVKQTCENNGFSRSVRVTKASDFKVALEQKAKFHSQMFALHVQENFLQDNTSARLGLVIGKRFAKQSVIRNLIKRCLREVFRLHRKQLPKLDFVVRLKKNVPILSRRELKKIVQLEARQLFTMAMVET